MPPNVPRKRTFAATADAYESDAENGLYTSSSPVRRQRTSSTSSVQTVRAVLPSAKKPHTSSTTRILQPVQAGDGQKLTGTSSPSATKPSSPSLIPRPVARTKSTRTLVKTASKPLVAFFTTKPSPAAPVIVKATKLKESIKRASDGVSVSVSDTMDPSASSTSKPTTIANKRTASSGSSSTKSLEALLSASDRGSLSRSSSGRSNVPSRLPPPTSQLPLPLRPLPDHAYIDDDGLVHLAASDCDLFITFPVTSDFEVWDIRDDTSIACPAYLYIMAKEPSLWSSASLSMPDITLVEIRCVTKRYQSHFSISEKFDLWECKFEGVELPRISDPKPKGVEGDDDSPKPATTPGSISTEMYWTRTLEMPAVGKCCNEFLEGREDLKVVRKVVRKTNTVAPVGSEDSERDDHQQRVPFIPGRGFKLKMWIPIPARLFLKKETRAFEIEAKVWIVPGAGLRGYHESTGRSGEAGFVDAKTEMTATHLRKERNMDFLY